MKSVVSGPRDPGASDPSLSFADSAPGSRGAPAADDSLVGVQRVCRTFPHHTGPGVPTHASALHRGAAGEAPSERRRR